jgi:hypothetical protein
MLEIKITGGAGACIEIDSPLPPEKQLMDQIKKEGVLSVTMEFEGFTLWGRVTEGISYERGF